MIMDTTCAQQPFPKSTEWVESQFPQDRKQSYLEHLYAVKYHLGFAEYASSQVKQQVYQMPFTINPDGTAITLIHPESYLTALIHQGDTAIREAASAFDTALCLVNDALQLNVEKAKVTWTKKDPKQKQKQKCKMRRALEAAGFTQLIEAIDKLYASIGLERLYEYRHGVTHRGAPAILLPDDWSNTIPLPAEIVREPDQGQKTWLLQQEIPAFIQARVSVQCYPFVHPVAQVINEHFDNVDHFEVPRAIKVVGGSNVHIDNFSVSDGSLSDATGDFETKNPISRETASVEYAGESLAVYVLADYTMQIKQDIEFMTLDAFRGDWDAELCEGCKTTI